jgi:hypothetical protein
MTHEETRAAGLAESELARLLAISPSPDFAAKVRSRILQRANSRQRHFRWNVAAAAVLVSAAAFMAAGILRAPGIRTPAAAPVISAPAQWSRPLGAPGLTPAIRAREAAPGAVPTKGTTIVLVPPDAQRALQRVVDLAATGALSAGAAALPAPLTEAPTRPVAPIVVEELDVIEIAVSGAAMEDGVD